MAGKKRVNGKSIKAKKSRANKAKPKRRDETDIISKGYDLTAGKKFAELIDLFEKEDATNYSNEQLVNYYRLLSFAYCNANKLLEGENYALEGLALDANDRDFHFTLAFIYASLRDYQNTLTHCNLFWDLSKESNKKDKTVYLSDGHVHLILNFQGLAHKASGNTDEAEQSFIESIKAQPIDHHPYLNLAALYRQIRRHEKAEEVINEGLKNCSQVQELRLVQKNQSRKETISACMIVKNEEKLLPNCLESIRHWVDEIIIVDTGSTDKTVEIAKSYGAKVYHQEWQNDFSFHRNYSISKATCDWILIIDADEEWESDNLDELWLAMAKDEFNLVSVNVFNMNRETGVYSSFLPSMRFIKRSSDIKYDGIVHNQLTIPKTEVIPRTNLRINHFGYDLSPEMMEKKLGRTKALLEKQLEEEPENCFAHFNMAQLLRSYTGDDLIAHNEKIIYHARRAVELSDTERSGSLAVHLQGHHQQVTTLINMKRYAEAEEICHKVLKIKPDYLDPILSLGHVCAAQFKLDEAEQYFLKYLELHDNYKPSEEILNIILIYINHEHVAYYGLGLIKQYAKNFDAAIVHYKKALEHLEPYQEAYSRLASIYLDKGEVETAYEYLQKELKSDNETDLLNLNLARYHGLKNEIEPAREYLEKALALTDANPEIFERAGVFYANLGQFDRAREMFAKLVELRPNYDYAVRQLAKVTFDGGDFNLSAEYYERLTSMISGNAADWNDLAGSYFKLGKFEKAELAYSKALEFDENLANAYRNLGLTKLKLGKNQEALALLENYSSLNRADIDIIKAIGTIYLNLSDYASAITYFETALQQNSDDLETLYYLSECYYHLGYGESAAVGYSKIIERNPDFEAARNRLEEIETAKTTG